MSTLIDHTTRFSPQPILIPSNIFFIFSLHKLKINILFREFLLNSSKKQYQTMSVLANYGKCVSPRNSGFFGCLQKRIDFICENGKNSSFHIISKFSFFFSNLTFSFSSSMCFLSFRISFSRQPETD